MIDGFEEFYASFVSTGQEAERLCYATRAKELQLNVITGLDALEIKARSIKASAVELRDEDFANRMLSYENALRAIRHELEMWVALKEENADAAWTALVTAQGAARLALRAHSVSKHLWGYLKRLNILERTLFPPIQFLSAGALVTHSTCSICGSEYGDCDHVQGRVYMGEVCGREIRQARLIETSLVDVPTNKLCRVIRFTDNGITRDALTLRVVSNDNPEQSVGDFEGIVATG